MSRHRGRPRKDKAGHSPEMKGRSYWLGVVFIDQGWAWAIDLIEIEPMDGRRRWETSPLCLGREDDIAPILKGERPMPEDMQPRQRRVLLRIMEDVGSENQGRNRSDDRVAGFSLSKRAGRSFRGEYRYRPRLER